MTWNHLANTVVLRVEKVVFVVLYLSYLHFVIYIYFNGEKETGIIQIMFKKCLASVGHGAFLCDNLVEVSDDVVEEAEALDVLMNELLLLIEVRETQQRGEEDTDSLVRL